MPADVFDKPRTGPRPKTEPRDARVGSSGGGRGGSSSSSSSSSGNGGQQHRSSSPGNGGSGSVGSGGNEHGTRTKKAPAREGDEPAYARRRAAGEFLAPADFEKIHSPGTTKPRRHPSRDPHAER